MYTTAECVVPDDLMVQLNINVSSITPSCETDTTGMFSLQLNAVVVYTLQVVSGSECGGSGIPIGMSHTGNFKVTSISSLLKYLHHHILKYLHHHQRFQQVQCFVDVISISVMLPKLLYTTCVSILTY